MTGSTRDRRVPGHLLHKIARIVFEPAVLADVVEPTLADLQQEVRDAGGSRRRQIMARARGYAAFWVLVAVSPLAFDGWPVGRRTAAALPGMSRAIGMAMFMGVGLTFVWPALGAWTMAAVIGGSFLALVLHAWYERHPLQTVSLEADEVGRPEINLSKIPVDGNAGGLMFAVGSIAILIVGLPAWRWYFLTTLAGGLLVAWTLVVWHAAHPSRRLPGSIAGR